MTKNGYHALKAIIAMPTMLIAQTAVRR